MAMGSLPLTPTDFFVLSRIEGPISVTELLNGSGMPVAEAEAVLTRLIALGVARLVAAPTPTPVATSER
ncbi:MAG: hypothetical protein IAG13_01070, partial [Deltaproteobacteria bacterium]|nr:hypothetical protein [Nannocystaceae bacterium]